MTDKAAFRATYSDWRLVKTRKVVQIVLEVPIESADAAYQVLGGMPDSAAERWVAVARLQQEGDQSIPVERSPSPESYATEAAIYCAKPNFGAFARSAMHPNETNAEFVRRFCGVKSRSEIIAGTEAGKSWVELRGQYEAWKKVPV